MMPSPSPLVDIGMSFVTDAIGMLGNDKNTELRQIITDYLENKIKTEDARKQCVDFIGTCKPIDKLEEILSLLGTPPPEKPKDFEDTPKARKKTRSWSNNEDMRLLAGVHKYGTDSWSNVAKFVGGGRSRSQCSQRWIRVLDPRISKEHWAKEEEEKLLKLISIHGEKSWMKIAQLLGNRSDVQCRYKYIQLHKDLTAQAVPEPKSNIDNIPMPISTHQNNPITLPILPQGISQKNLTVNPMINHPPLIVPIPTKSPTTPVYQNHPKISQPPSIPQPAKHIQIPSIPPDAIEVDHHDTIFNQDVSNDLQFGEIRSVHFNFPPTEFKTSIDEDDEDNDMNTDVEIPLTSSSIDLRKSEPLFDSNIWLLRVE